MGLYDGQVSEKHGRTAMLWFDGGAGALGAVFIVLVALLLKPPSAKPPESEAAASDNEHAEATPTT